MLAARFTSKRRSFSMTNGLHLLSAICLLALTITGGCAAGSPAGVTREAAAPASQTAACTNATQDKFKAKGPIAPVRRDVPGTRGNLSIARIYVPERFTDNGFASNSVVVWFLGAPWCAEQAFYDAGKNAFLITVTTKELWETFRHPEALNELLTEADDWLKKQGVSDKPLGPICLASFSGGYVAIREILKHEQYRNRITDVVLADSLYAPRVPGRENELDALAMAPFLDYAARAAAGDGVFLFSHLYPPRQEHRGNTTTLAAAYLIEQLAITRKPASGHTAQGAEISYRADKNGFHVFGVFGMTTQDHFDHFYSAADLLRLTSFPDVN